MIGEASILVVDDDVDICSNVSDILIDLGYRTDVAYDGHAALELIKENTYDIAVMDFKMPGMDGATLYSEIRRIHPEIVAIMVTAYAGSDGAQRALDAGTWRVLRKPLDFSRLLPLIDEALNQPLLLIVDDDTEFCDSLWQILRESGYRAGIAINADTAAAHVSHRHYDIVLLDLKLTEEDGGEQVFREIDKLDVRTRTLLITGHRTSMQSKIEELLSSGAEGIHYKPLDMDELLRRVEQLTG